MKSDTTSLQAFVIQQKIHLHNTYGNYKGPHICVGPFLWEWAGGTSYTTRSRSLYNATVLGSKKPRQVPALTEGRFMKHRQFLPTK